MSLGENCRLAGKTGSFLPLPVRISPTSFPVISQPEFLTSLAGQTSASA
jgi:hypothetical protein